MSTTLLSGPDLIAGPLMGLPASSPESALFGPSLTYQADAIPDVRFAPINRSNITVGSIPAHLNSPYFLLTDTIPAASAATPVNIAAAQSGIASGVALTLVATGSTGVNPGTTLVPFQSTAPVSVVGLDLGFAMGTTTAATGTISTVVRTNTTANAVALFTVGQWLHLGNVGNSSGTVGMFTMVTAVGATSITVSPVPLRSASGVSIASANVYDPNLSAISTALPTSISPYLGAGALRLLNPLETCSRNVGIAGSSGAASGTFRVNGYNIYGQAMSENIVHTGSTGVAYGKKAFKYVSAVTPLFTDATHGFSVGTGDTFGVAVRSDFWEYTNLFWNGAFLSAQTGWLAADLTSPALATTGDNMGTLQVSARGNGSGASATVSNGAIRLAIFASIPLYNLIAATPQNPVPMYGVTPA